MIKTRLGDGTHVCERSEFFSRPLLWAIASSSEADVNELVEARILIEVELAGMAAERATDDHIERLAELLDRMIKLKRSPMEFVQADVDFHLTVARAASNKILMNALQLIRNLLQRWIMSAITTKGIAEKACSRHKRVLTAIKVRDVAAARKEMKKH